ncbi:hypothetical protein Taro_017278 [Colocasia esculenta]|uniref:Uncharacterized protein n=1 Tax=Colocasia esculenta TaxID=4460 RepID=A0A843UST5_COLES|nr:hypothetical protein [Colocasia esculenta]
MSCGAGEMPRDLRFSRSSRRRQTLLSRQGRDRPTRRDRVSYCDRTGHRVLKSRFDPFEVCPGVGTVVTAVVACGVPEWWNSFSYGWYEHMYFLVSYTV